MAELLVAEGRGEGGQPQEVQFVHGGGVPPGPQAPPVPQFGADGRRLTQKDFFLLRTKEMADAVGGESLKLNWPPNGYFQCLLCDSWILIFPNGKKITRWYAEQHCVARHLQQPVFQCKSELCNFTTTMTMTAMRDHQRRRVCHRGIVKPGFDRLLTKEKELDLAAELVKLCWPHVSQLPTRRHYVETSD